jgi:hypothetical protein
MMIGRKAVVGLSLLLALFCSAFVAQSASAAVAKNTTAFTCVKGGGQGDFKDAHCDEKVAAGKGEYGHVAVEPGKTTTAVITNEKTKNGTTETTPTTFKGTAFGAKLEGSCQTVNGEGTFKNEEPEPGVHTGSGTGTIKATNCKVDKPLKCTVKEPLEIPGLGTPVEGLGAGKNEMGAELKPASGEIFSSVTLENKGEEICPLAGKPLEVKGTAIATSTLAPTEIHTGATAVLTNAMTKETLSLGGKPVEVSGTSTVRPVVEGKVQNPLSSTTVT